MRACQISDWPKPLREITLSRNARRRRTTCVGPDDLRALRPIARFGFGRFAMDKHQGSEAQLNKSLQRTTPATPVAEQHQGRRAAELFRSAASARLG